MKKLLSCVTIQFICIFIILLMPLISLAATCQFITQNNYPLVTDAIKGGLNSYFVTDLPRPYLVSSNRQIQPLSDTVGRSEDKKFLFVMNSENNVMFSFKISKDCSLDRHATGSLLDRGNFKTLGILQYGEVFLRLAKPQLGTIPEVTQLQIYAYDTRNGATFPEATSTLPTPSFIKVDIPHAVSMYYNRKDNNIYITTSNGEIMIYQLEKVTGSIPELKLVKSIHTPYHDVKGIKVLGNDVFLLSYDSAVNNNVGVFYLRLDEAKNIIGAGNYIINDNQEKHTVLDHISSFIVIYNNYPNPNLLPYRIFVYHRGIIHELMIISHNYRMIESQNRLTLGMSAPLLNSPLDIINSVTEMHVVPNVIFATQKYQTPDKDLFTSLGSRQTAIYPEAENKTMSAVSYYMNIKHGDEVIIPTDNLASLIVNYPE